MEEYMESELSGIFRVKLVTKNIVRGSPGIQFMHMRVNELIRSKIETSRLDVFVNTVLNVLSKNTPVKKRYVRANETPFMSKVLNKTITKRLQLRDFFSS